MRSKLRRLFWAAILSTCGFCGTWFWYHSTQDKRVNNDKAPLAQVKTTTDEVLRRPSTRLLWTAVNIGDNLYSGEIIHTFEHGEARIQFEDGRFIDLEPNSMIVLKKSQKEIVLDLMEGSLFVNAENQAAAQGEKSNLVLNSENGKVDLTGSSASLSKAKAGDDLDIQVHAGTAKIKNTKGEVQEVSKDSSKLLSKNSATLIDKNLKIISPVGDKPVFVDPDEPDEIVFEWQGFQAGSQVNLWAGERRTTLKNLGQVESAKDNSREKIKASLPLGKQYWKLVAKDPKTGKVTSESSLFKLEILGRYLPTVIFPPADAKILTDNPTYDLNFKWQKDKEASRVGLEVSTDALMKKKVDSQIFSDQNQYTLSKLKLGEYFWRMNVYYEGSEKPIAGKIQKFSIANPVKEPPKDPARVSWQTPETTIQEFFISDPTLQLAWQAETRKDEIKEWRLTASEVGPHEVSSHEEASQKFTLKEAQIKTKMTHAGEYRCVVEALNKEGLVIGKTPERIMAVRQLPLPISPRILPLQGDLQALKNGSAEVQWQSVSGIKEYLLIVKTPDGREVTRKKSSSTQTVLLNLLPGKYSLQALSTDQYGRNSEAVESRTLIVPDKSDARAPATFKAEVKKK